MNNKQLKMTWNNLNLRQFCDIQRILSDEDFDDLEKTVELLKVLTQNEDIDDLPIEEFQEFIPLLSVLKSPLKPNKIKRKYVVNDHEYVFPDSIEHLSTAQYIDYINITRQNNRKITLENIDKLLACLLTTKEDLSFEKRVDDVLNMNVCDVLAMSEKLKIFFLKSLNRFRKSLVGMIVNNKEVTMRERLTIAIETDQLMRNITQTLTD